MNNYSQEKRNSMIRQENVRASMSQPIQSPPRIEVQTNEKHQGCVERMILLTKELDRMSEALRQKNQDIQYLQNELQNGRNQQQNDYGNDQLKNQILLEKQKYEQLKNMKDDQIMGLENELQKVYKELKDERLQKLDYVDRYEKQCNEVVRLQKELEKSKSKSIDSEQINELHNHIDDLEQENNQLKIQNNGLSQKIQQNQQQIALLEDQLTSAQNVQPLPLPPQGPATYQLPQMQYQQQQPQTSTYSKVTTYKVENKGTGKPTEVKQQVVKTVNGKTDVYEYSSSKDPMIGRESLSSRLDNINIQGNPNMEVRNSQLQNNTSASQLQRGSKYLPDTYKKDYLDVKSKVEQKPVTEYKTTVTTTTNNNKYQRQQY